MYKTFLRWVLFVSLIAVGIALAATQGIVQEIWSTDIYYISTLICGIFAYSTISCGFLAFKVGGLKHKSLSPKQKKVQTEVNKTKMEQVAIILERNWFLASLLSSLGFLGTVLGMLLMVAGIGQMDLANVNLTDFGNAMAFALITTATGLVTRILLRIQCFTIQQTISSVQEKIIFEE